MCEALALPPETGSCPIRTSKLTQGWATTHPGMGGVSSQDALDPQGRSSEGGPGTTLNGAQRPRQFLTLAWEAPPWELSIESSQGPLGYGTTYCVEGERGLRRWANSTPFLQRREPTGHLALSLALGVNSP